MRKTIGKDKNGKPVLKAFYGSSKQDAERKYQQWLIERSKGITIDSDISLTQAMFAWLWSVEKISKNKSTTFDRYEGIYRLYIDGTSIGYMPIGKIEQITLQQYYNELYEQGKSYSQIFNCNKLLRKFFRYCVARGYLLRDPCFGIDLDVYKEDEDELTIDEELEDEGKIETYTPDEIQKIIHGDYNRKLKIFAKFALGTGLRHGEILALRTSDVDLDLMEVSVTKTLSLLKVFDDPEKYHYEWKATKPKTKSSRRKVPIPTELKKDLQELNKIRIEEKLKLGQAYNDNDLLFPSATGTYLDQRNVLRAWERALKRIGVEYKNIHALRHTYATQLIENGVPLMTVSRLLGHSTIKTTERYVHVLQESKRDEVQKLNKLFV